MNRFVDRSRVACVVVRARRLSVRLTRLAAPATPASPERPPFDVLITNGRVVDGTGAPWFRADIGINGDRISAIGQLAGRKATTTHRRIESRRRARLHRHARPVGVQRPRRSARRQQDYAGHHDGDHRRGRVDRAAQRRAGAIGAGHLRPLQGHARLPHPQRIFRAAREEPAGDQRRHVRRRRRHSRLRARQRPEGGGAGRSRGDEEARRPGDATGRAGRQHVAAVRARPLRLDRRDRRAREGRAAVRRHLHLAPAIRVRPDHVVARRSVRGRRARQHSRGGLAPQDRLQGELGTHARGVEALRRRARARARRHRQHVSLRSRLERPRCVPAAVGARRRARSDAGAPQGSVAARAHQARHGRRRTPRTGRTSGTDPAAAPA